jgi:hypothetical protein
MSISITEEDDSVFESDLMASPYSVRVWYNYTSSKADERARLPLYERALALLPGSYKLWNAYLNDSLKLVRKSIIQYFRYRIFCAAAEPFCSNTRSSSPSHSLTYSTIYRRSAYV